VLIAWISERSPLQKNEELFNPRTKSALEIYITLADLTEPKNSEDFFREMTFQTSLKVKDFRDKALSRKQNTEYSQRKTAQPK
jgi:hypothetical protein